MPAEPALWVMHLVMDHVHNALGLQSIGAPHEPKATGKNTFQLKSLRPCIVIEWIRSLLALERLLDPDDARCRKCLRAQAARYGPFQIMAFKCASAKACTSTEGMPGPLSSEIALPRPEPVGSLTEKRTDNCRPTP